MRKHRSFRISAVILCLLLLLPLSVCAAEPDVEASCSLTLHYVREEAVFSGLEIRIYRVAEALEGWEFQKLEPYSGWPVNIHGITSQEEWQTAADTLTAYITAEGTEPYRTETTDGSGTAFFDDLETGLYLVAGAVASNEQGTWSFDRFMVYLPTPGEDGYLYHVEALPKCSGFTPAPESRVYKLLKVWQDAGFEEQRPVSVTVYPSGRTGVGNRDPGSGERLELYLGSTRGQRRLDCGGTGHSGGLLGNGFRKGTGLCDHQFQNGMGTG